MGLDFSKFAVDACGIIHELTNVAVSQKVDSGAVLLKLLTMEAQFAQKMRLNTKICAAALTAVNVWEADVDGFSVNVHRAVQLAEIEAWRDNAGLINNAHLLIGLLEDKSGRAALALRQLGVNADKARQVLRTLESVAPTENRGTDAAEWLVDLVGLARDGRLDPVRGRDAELGRLMQVLSRRRKNNPVLIGPAGVGKTALAEGLALMVAHGTLPSQLNISKIYVLDLAALVAGTKYRGEFEARLKEVLRDVTQNPACVLFIDEIHMLMGAGGAESALDASNILKPALARGELRCIGATTPAEYRRYIAKDAAFARRFQAVTVPEPSQAVVLDMLRGLRPLYEEHHGVPVADEMLDYITDCVARFVHGRYFPDKAIDLLDEALARAGLQAGEDARRLNRVDVATVVHQWTGLPVDVIMQGHGLRLAQLEQKMTAELFGQDDALRHLMRILKRRFKVNVQVDFAPILIQGPSHSGKTAALELLAAVLYADRNVTELDLSGYSEKHSLSGLIGTTQGFVGYGEQPVLSRLLRQSANGMLVLRNLSKAHSVVQDLLAGLFRSGNVIDGMDNVLKAGNTLFVAVEETTASLPQAFNGAQVVIFTTLDAAAMRQIAGKLLADLSDKLQVEGFKLRYTPDVLTYLQNLTSLETMCEVFSTIIEYQSLELVLNGNLNPGQTLCWNVSGDALMMQDLPQKSELV